MKLAEQKYRQAKITDLKPHPRQVRQGDVGAIHSSIEQNGFYGALIVQKSTQYVCAGNHRLLAAQHAGATSIPILELDCDDETALKILLVDNRTSDLATYDDPELAELLRILAEADALIGTGYAADDVDDLLARMQEDAFLPNADANVGHTFSLTEKAERYAAAGVRSVVLEYPLIQFRWVADALSALRLQYGMESNQEVVRRLIETATGETCPHD